MPLLPDKQADDQERLLATRARIACRKWAHVRVGLLSFFDARPELRKFDEQMFALGEAAHSGAQGELVRDE